MRKMAIEKKLLTVNYLVAWNSALCWLCSSNESP